MQAREDHARVAALLAEEKLHLKPGLTAQMLSDRLGWAPERLTTAFREGGTSFFDAINAARVQEVKRRANDPLTARLSLLVLAFDAGFGSKTAFYDAFQRYAGCTPAAWRRREAARRS
jgi:AraC-like DNA-binding protein